MHSTLQCKQLAFFLNKVICSIKLNWLVWNIQMSFTAPLRKKTIIFLNVFVKAISLFFKDAVKVVPLSFSTS